MTGRNGAAQQPGYLVVRVGEDGSYTGGLMVTDRHGLPLDFRYTDPVTPTRLQRALYGAALDRYLRSEVVLKTLLTAVQQRPALLLVEDERLLDEEIAGCPVVFAGSSRASALGDPGTLQEEGESVYLAQIDAGGAPLRVAMAASRSGEIAGIVGGLVELAETMDVLEPASRVRQALDLIATGEATQ
jgi:hypothetical protein